MKSCELCHCPRLVRDQVIMDYMPLVVFEARKLFDRLPPIMECDDLISVGVIGLMDAVQRFDPERNVKFKTYAVFRIRGSMLDHLRTNDAYSRSARQLAREIHSVSERFMEAHGRKPAVEEIAHELGRSADNLRKRLSDLPWGTEFETRDFYDDEHEKLRTPAERACDEVYLKQEAHQALAEVIEKTCNPREQTVLQMYYWDELSLVEIAQVLGVTESRVSQILSQAKRRIQTKLNHHELFGAA